MSEIDTGENERGPDDWAVTGEARDAIFRNLLEFAPDAIVITGDDGCIRLVNTQAEVMFGYERGELLGQPVEILLPESLKATHPVHRDRYSAQLRTRPMGAGLDLAARRKDGSEVPVEISLSPLETAEGRLITSVIRDITDRKKAQEELAVRARQQAIVVELGRRALSGTELAILMDEAASSVARTLRVEWASVLELLPGGDSFLMRAGVGWKEGTVGQAILGAGTRSHAGYTLLIDEPLCVADIDAEPRFECPPLLRDLGVVSLASVILHVQNRPFGILDAHASRGGAFTTADVTFLQAVANVLAAAIERKRGEQLQRERDLLRAEKMEAVGQVAASVAHELRNPLTAIKGLIQVNRREAESCGLPVEDMRVIEEAIRRMERTLQTFFDFARPPEPERHLQGLGEIVDRTLALARGRAEERKVSIVANRQPDPIIVEVDGGQIQQLLLNLVLNALDAMPLGGSLEVQVDHDCGEAEVRLLDTGPGVDPSLLPRIFDPFVSGKEGGLGLGLAVSRRIAEDHGGRLAAENRPGVGACFVLRLPSRQSP
jgi:PAS domain S-box-containing protein